MKDKVIYDSAVEKVPSALDVQVSGSHYRDMEIQPSVFIHKNNLGYLVGNVIKYICRYRFKNGKDDIDKAIHYLEILREMEYGRD